MSKKKQIAEMRRRKEALTSKIEALREGKTHRPSLSMLIESELERAELVLAAKAILDKLGKMAEDLAKVEGDDILPMLDAFRTAYGPQKAEQFHKAAVDTLRQTVETLTKSKDVLGQQIDGLEGAINGEGNDMASFDDNTEAPADMGAADDMAADADVSADDMGLDADADVPAEPDDNLDADASAKLDDIFGAGDEDNAAGRARKESVSRRGKALTESLIDSIRSYLAPQMAGVPASGSPREKLDALKAHMFASDYEIVSQFPDQLLQTLFDASTDVPAMAPVAPVAPAMDDYDDYAGDDMGMGSDMGSDMGADAAPMGDYYDPAYESAGMKRLREAANPDAVIFNAFRKGLREGMAPVKAAKKVAEAFAIDLVDVVQIVKENAKLSEGKPMISDQLASKYIADKIMGTPDLTMPKIKQLVARYVSSMGKAPTDVDFIAAQVFSILQDKGLVESKKPDADKDGIPDWADKKPFKKGGKADRKVAEAKKKRPFDGGASAPTLEAKAMKGKDPCWPGYEMVGRKKKGGKMVPNCVPKVDEDYQNGSGTHQTNSGSHQSGPSTPPTGGTTAPKAPTPPTAPTPTTPADKAMVDKADKLASKIRAMPDVNSGNLDAKVKQTMGTVGASPTDAEEMTGIVRADLVRQGALKEGIRRRKV